jgi:hypothetical protein
MRKIGPDLEKEILARAAQGHSARVIAQWIRDDRGMKITHQAVGHVIRQTRQTRAEVTKLVVREALTGQVVSDIDVLAESLRRVVRLEERLHARAHKSLDTLEKMAAGETDGITAEDFKIAVLSGHDSSELALKASDRVRSIADTKLHYSGADDKDTTGDNSVEGVRAAQDELLGRLARIASAGEASRDRPGPVQH